MKLKNDSVKTTGNLFKKISPVFPAFLLTFSYLFTDYHAKAAVSVPPNKLLGTLVVFWLMLLPVFFIIEKVTKNRLWASIYLYLFVLTIYLSEEFFYIILILIVAVSLAWVSAHYILVKKMAGLKHFLYIGTIIPSVIFAIIFFQVIPFYFKPDWKTYNTSMPRSTDAVRTSFPPDKTLPDIYYIVLDGYGRADILRNYYGYDNSEFINRLNKLGFVVPANAHSNYAKTVSSLTSTLNMNYIPEVMNGVDNSLFWWQSKPFLQRSVVQLSLEQLGYKSIAIASDWDITNNTKANIHLKPRPFHFTEFEGNLITKSRLSLATPLIQQAAFYPTNDSHRELINYSFKKMSELSEMEGAKFIFAHITAPHPPFVFDEHGNSITPAYGFTFNDANDFPGNREEYLKGYVGQLQHLNRLLEQTIEVILSQSDTPPIIIIQADHGPGMLTDFTSLEDTCLEERFSIFAAYHLPDAPPETIPDDITPVNIFRIIFNTYFSTDLPMLDKASYYLKDTVYVYHNENITNRLNQGVLHETCASPPLQTQP